MLLTDVLISIVWLLVLCNAVVGNSSPEIVLAPKDQRVLENGIASFFCKATGNPAPDIYWRRGGKRLTHNHQRYFITTMPQGSVLRIQPAKARRDDSVFECVADNGVEEPAVSRAMLEVYPEGQVPNGYPRIVDSPRLKSVEKNRNTVMMCSANGNPEPTISWLKDFVPIDFTDQRLKILSVGSLQISLSQESDEGKYECVAENQHGVVYSYGANLYVRVRRVPPHFSILPEDVDVMPGGSVNLTCVAVGSPMPEVWWMVGQKRLTPETNVPIGINVLELHNVRESGLYVCTASSELGNIKANASVRVKALPRAPTNLTFTEVTATSAYLRWQPVVLDPVDSYAIQFREQDTVGSQHQEVSDVRSSEFNVTSLRPYTTYEFRVMAVNNIGRGIPSHVLTATTLETVPSSPPANVRARPVSSTTIVVEWDEPELANGIILGYKVFYSPTPNVKLDLWSLDVLDNKQLHTISNLETDRTYSISVLAFNSRGDGPLSPLVQVQPRHGVPEQPVNLRAEVISSTALQLTWSPPKISPGDRILSYDIYYDDSLRHRTVQVKVRPPQAYYRLDDLAPNTQYSIRVSATTALGEGASTPAIQVKTREAAPSAAPVSVNVEPVSSTALRVSWQPVPERWRNGVIVGYKIMYSEIQHNTEGEINVLTVTGANQWMIEGLKKWTSYKIWLLAFTQAGDGRMTEIIIARTDEDVPGEPRRVRADALNSTAIYVQWHEPAEEEKNGVIRGYQVFYVQTDTDRQPFVRDTMDGSVTHVLLEELKEDTEYSIQIAAYTRKGDGARSKSRKVRTKGIVLGPPRGFQVWLMQEEPPVVSTSWQAPRGVVDEVIEYRLTYGVLGDSEVEERRLTADKFAYTTGFLNKGVEYEFRLSAQNSVDYGDMAIATIKTPDGTPTGGPLNFTAIGLNPSSVRLQWDAPAREHRNGEIILYEIFYHQRKASTNDMSVNMTDNHVIIDNLEPVTDYIFQIRAYTSQGAGPWSTRIPFRTFAHWAQTMDGKKTGNQSISQSIFITEN